jgi:hypothetical protein
MREIQLKTRVVGHKHRLYTLFLHLLGEPDKISRHLNVLLLPGQYHKEMKKLTIILLCFTVIWSYYKTAINAGAGVAL